MCTYLSMLAKKSEANTIKAKFLFNNLLCLGAKIGKKEIFFKFV